MERNERREVEAKFEEKVELIVISDTFDENFNDELSSAVAPPHKRNLTWVI
jgi:hypothetical protein